jgi:hypothetical protein
MEVKAVHDGKKLIIKSKDLPLPLELQGENGEREIYILKPAGRKFGACLNKVPDMLRRLFLQGSNLPSMPKAR